MNPHNQYGKLVGLGTLAMIGLILIGGGPVAQFWFFPTLPILLIRWAVISFRRLSAKKAANANRPTPARESGD